MRELIRIISGTVRTLKIIFKYQIDIHQSFHNYVPYDHAAVLSSLVFLLLAPLQNVTKFAIITYLDTLVSFCK